MRNVWKALGLALVLAAWPGTSQAVIATIDNVPAATLLLPYFEVDPAATATRGVDTLLSITDVSATAVLVHVTVWTDAAVVVTGFNVYFTGFDTVALDLQSILAGTLPATASAGQDSHDTISPKGPKSQDINYASCTGQLPPAATDPAKVAKWVAALSGKPDPDNGRCSGFDHGDGILRGYVTIDTVNNCTVRNPGDPGYFGSGGSGDATLQNYLFGNWTLVDNTSKRYQSGSLVAIEASATNPETSTAGQYTFYGRYVNWTAADNREPLVTNFGTRYVTGGGTGRPNNTTLLVWRDTKVAQAAFACGSNPGWYPLAQEGIFFFDEQEAVQSLSTTIQSFPLATQKVQVDSSALPANFATGWVYLDLNATVAAAGSNPSEDPAALQGWVEVLRTDDDPPAYGAHGHLGFSYRPVLIDTAASASHAHP